MKINIAGGLTRIYIVISACILFGVGVAGWNSQPTVAEIERETAMYVLPFGPYGAGGTRDAFSLRHNEYGKWSYSEIVTNFCGPAKIESSAERFCGLHGAKLRDLWKEKAWHYLEFFGYQVIAAVSLFLFWGLCSWVAQGFAGKPEAHPK